MKEIFTIQKGSIHAIPITHYTMEFAGIVHRSIQEVKPDCVAVEFAETMQLQLLHAASRLPISASSFPMTKQPTLYIFGRAMPFRA
ncbi:hypothetical protein WCH_CG14460 [Waddlia chondrophila 2032/99]|uniref:Uncharacterized protein n=1 Tax=Waddlia chondrophila 2032/99 TaxID=765953 RepID=F8LA57_9BACT|nr:hypothetical protein WCH_CG14460 [Waddlia chondrophila 2032/99]